MAGYSHFRRFCGLALGGVVACGALNASGFKISEQSLRSIALSSAYVAAAYGADSSYYNPANMGFSSGIKLNTTRTASFNNNQRLSYAYRQNSIKPVENSDDRHELEVALTAIYIPGFNFTVDTTNKTLGEGSINWGLSSSTTMKIPLSDTAMDAAKFFGVNLDSLKDPIPIDHGGDGNLNQHGTIGYVSEGTVTRGSADSTLFPIPKIFYKSKSFGGGFNVGLSFTAPSGLAMTWNGEAGAFLKDVMIAIVELAPAISYQYKEVIGIGISPRILYGMGTFNNTVYVPLNGTVLTNLQGYDRIPEEMVPAAMQELIYAVNTATSMAGFAGLFVGGGGHYNNTLRYQMPTLFNPEVWFGLPEVSALGDPHNVSEYNAKVAQVNAQIKANWNHYLGEWDNGNLEWRYNSQTCVSQTAICLPTGLTPVPYQTYKTTLLGEERVGIKFINGYNYCIQNNYSTSWWLGCQNMKYTELDRIKTEYGIKTDLYVNCYTGTFFDYNGNPQTSNPGPCAYPTPTEKDEDGAPRGYLTLMDAKQVAEAFGMGNMDISTALQGSTKVDQKSNGADLAFGYRVGLTVRPFDFKNYSLTISGVYDSPVKFNFKGKLDADTYIGGSIGDINMKAALNLMTQLPAQLKIGVAQRFFNLTIEAVYERIMWGDGKKFEFAFSNPQFSALQANSLIAGFTPEQIESMMSLANYDAVAMGKGWKNTSAYRLGLTYKFDGGTVLMASAAYDESPVPQQQIGIPDSTAYMFGGGINIPVTQNLTLGGSATVYLKDGSKSIYQSQNGMGKLILGNISLGYAW